jgi:6-phosphogluconolactonase
MASNITFLSASEQQKTAQILIDKIFRHFQATTPPYIFALPGGRSILPILTQLKESSSDLPSRIWKDIHFFLVDERLVALDHNDCNFKLLHEHLFSTLKLRELVTDQQLHSFQYVEQAVDYGLSPYNEELKNYGGKFDVAILGVGEDAHVGALFPKHPLMSDQSTTSYVTLLDSPKPPPARMTSSRKLLEETPLLVGLFFGAGKKQALKDLLDPNVAIENCPAKIIGQAKQGIIITDILDLIPSNLQ